MTTTLSASAVANSFDHTHAKFNEVLSTHVKDGVVNYRALQVSPQQLDSYLADMAAVTKAQFRGWSNAQQLAFYINLYNAGTLKLIIKHYPVQRIKDIGGWFGSPWKQEFISLFGETVHLDYIEHDVIRPEYKEPRIHFAVVCAAKGCPPLRSEAYVAARLSTQLDDQARVFMQQSSKNRVDRKNNRVYLSRIFDWYGEDFAKNEAGILRYLQSYLPAIADMNNPSVRYTDYDWSLNE